MYSKLANFVMQFVHVRGKIVLHICMSYNIFVTFATGPEGMARAVPARANAGTNVCLMVEGRSRFRFCISVLSGSKPKGLGTKETKECFRKHEAKRVRKITRKN